MHFFDTITITLAGLMVGNELALSAFVNPAVWQLESGPQAQALSILARSLGRAMPVWYGLCLALLTFPLVGRVRRRTEISLCRSRILRRTPWKVLPIKPENFSSGEGIPPAG